MPHKHNPLPPLPQLREMFDLDAGRGVLIRRYTYKNFKEGEVVGFPRPAGHIYTKVNGTLYPIHRLIWYMVTGMDPGEFFVDHINGDPADNRPSNLRLADHQENGRHRVNLLRTNKSGHRNVWYAEREDVWKVAIKPGKDGKRIQRRFRTKEDAIAFAAETRAQLYGEYAGLTP